MPTMTHADAALTLYRYKHIEDSRVTQHEADQAREVLRSSFSQGKKWVRVKPSPKLTHHDFLRSFLKDMLEGSDRSSGSVPIIVPHGEWLEFWKDHDGQAVALTSHYYRLEGKHLRDLLAFADQCGLHLRFDGHGSWKNAGHAIIVSLERR